MENKITTLTKWSERVLKSAVTPVSEKEWSDELKASYLEIWNSIELSIVFSTSIKPTPSTISAPDYIFVPGEASIKVSYPKQIESITLYYKLF